MTWGSPATLKKYSPQGVDGWEEGDIRGLNGNKTKMIKIIYFKK